MATSAVDLLGNVHDYFLNLFNTAGSTGQNAVLCFDPGGVTVAPADFKIQATDPTYSPAKAIEEVSHLTDILPSSIADGVFHRTQRSIELLVGMIIDGATPTSADNLATLGAAKSQVKSVYDDNELRTFAGNFSYRPASATPVDWYDPTVASNWAAYHFASGTPPDPSAPPPGPKDTRVPLLCWMVLPETLTPLLQGENYRSVLRSRRELINAPQVDMQAADQITPLSSSPAKLRMSRQPFMASESLVSRPAVSDATMLSIANTDTVAAVAPVQAIAVAQPAFESQALNTVIQSQQVAVAVPQGEMATVSLAVSRDTLSISSLSYSAEVASAISAASTPAPVEAPDLEISFQYCVVRLSRPWFPELLLFTKGWYIAGYGSNTFATGNLVDPKALFPCLPTGFVALKDLVIKGTWSQADTSAAAGSASLGPFSLVGSTGAGTGSFTNPGVQIFAWLCEPLSPMPPDGDPTLNPAPSPPAAT